MVVQLCSCSISDWKRSSIIEVFANDGEQPMTAWIYTPQSADGITFAADGKATVTVEQFELNL